MNRQCTSHQDKRRKMMGVIEAVIWVVIEHWACWVGEGWVGAGWLGTGDLGAGVLGMGIVDACRCTYMPYAFWTCQAGSCMGKGRMGDISDSMTNVTCMLKKIIQIQWPSHHVAKLGWSCGH